MRYPTLAVLGLASVVVAIGSVSVANTTIDDTFGDERTGAVPVYTSVHLWNARSSSDGCTTCGAQPDGSQFLNRSHDESTYAGQIASNMSISFIGTSIRLYCALANEVNLNPRATHLVFFLDNSVAPVSTFDHEPTADIGYAYNQLVYDSGALPLGKHTVLVSNVATADVGSLILFDYAVYSTEVEDDNTATGSHTSAPPVSVPSTSSLSILTTGSSTRDAQSHTLVSSAPPSGSASSMSPTASGTHLVPPASTSTKNMDGGYTRSGMSVGAIAGAAVSGGVAALFVVCAALCCYTRRLRRRTEPVADMDDPHATVTPYSEHAALDGRSPQHITPTLNWKRKTIPMISSIPPSNVSSSSPRSNADLGSEVARMRVELERLRRIADHDTPPRYEDGSV
ncbi:hypothetical protein EXIGLDRAFT_839965 [Exidia glandulosa HHB12029]|uniref:Uncharacterized protein n=1 Tax=Exidia glandulosa HHB12029 TaxID=1314781 RepID=A0A165EPT9_EXIGL|nr:hypothetical protein EXIGLDRAFT_839965 [Exidia glandulosa HHB12029]